MWPFLEKQRRLLARENGAVIKDWGGKLSIALVYPNTYHTGMSNLAIHSLYKIFNDHPQVVCERAFLPDPQTLLEHRRTRTPILSMESQRPLHEFDVVAFSISFQNDFLNIIPMLSLCSVPYRASKRTDEHPLIIAGGCAVSMNPHPLDEIFDAFVLGEAEEIAGEMIPIMSERLSHEQTREALSKISGIYTPHPHPLPKGERARSLLPLPFGERERYLLPLPPAYAKASAGKRGERAGVRVTRRIVKDLDSWPTQTVVYTPHTEFGDMHLIEMSRGCPRHCNFCATPCLYTPYRARNIDALLKMISTGLSFRKRFGLIGSDLLSHKAFPETVNHIHDNGATFSPSSLRADEVDDNVATVLARSGHKSISLGIEAASERLRSSLGKRFSNERILETVKALASHGICTLRLYFMIGLPGETEEDINAIAELSALIQSTIESAAPKSSRSSSITLTVNPFVPKPFTPFERMPFASEKILKEKIKILRRLTKSSKGILVHVEPVVSATCDAVFSRGDNKLISFLERSFEKDSPRKALSALHEDDLRHLERGFEKEEELPWLQF